MEKITQSRVPDNWEEMNDDDFFKQLEEREERIASQEKKQQNKLKSNNINCSHSNTQPQQITSNNTPKVTILKRNTIGQTTDEERHSTHTVPTQQPDLDEIFQSKETKYAEARAKIFGETQTISIPTTTVTTTAQLPTTTTTKSDSTK